MGQPTKAGLACGQACMRGPSPGTFPVHLQQHATASLCQRKLGRERSALAETWLQWQVHKMLFWGTDCLRWRLPWDSLTMPLMRASGFSCSIPTWADSGNPWQPTR